MPIFSKRCWIYVSVICLVTLFVAAIVVFCASRKSPDISKSEVTKAASDRTAVAPAQKDTSDRTAASSVMDEDTKTFLELRQKWDRTAVGQAPEEFAQQCLALAEKYPDTQGELAALYLAACRSPKTEPGKTAREMFITRIPKADLGHLLKTFKYVHNSSGGGLAALRHYRRFKDQGVVIALLDRLKQSPNNPHTVELLMRVCIMSKGSSDKEPTAQFAEAADLVVSQYATSADIYNFPETLAANGNSRRWAQPYERHLKTIIEANKHRFVQCTAMFALASVAQSFGQSHQEEAAELYKQFLEKFDGKYEYPYQGPEQYYRKEAKKQIEEIRLRGIGKPAPEMVGVDLDGRQIKLSEYRGKVVLVSFWATWCNPCMKLIPHERAMATRLKNKPFAIVGINGDRDEAAAKKAVETHEITWRSFRDKRANKAAISDEWAISGWPTLYLIDHEGIIRGKWLGGPHPERLNKAIDQLLDTVQ